MQINNLPASNITEPISSVAAPEPVKPAAKAPAAPKPAATAVKEPPKTATPPKKEEAAAKTGEKDVEITDVKATGDTTTEGEPTFTLKVNGKEYKATQSEIINLAQKARGAEAAMKQKAELEKLAADLLDNFDKDAYGLMVKRHGKEKADQMVIAMTRKLIQEEEKDPKDREIEKLRGENETFKQAQEREKKEREDADRKVKQTELYGRMLREIDTELDQTHLPKDKLTLTRVLNYLAAGKKANGQAWSVKDAVQAVEVEDMSHASHYAKRYVEGKLPSEKFKSIFGEEAFKKLNKEQIELLKNADKVATHEQPKSDSPPIEAPKKRTLSKTRGSVGMSEREYRKQHGSLGGI